MQSMLCLLSRTVWSMKRAAMTLQRNCVPLGNTSASRRSRRSARVIAYTDAAFSTNAQAAKMYRN